MIRLGVLALLVTSGSTSYDDWYTTDEGVLESPTFESMKPLNNNFTKYLRSGKIYAGKTSKKYNTLEMSMKELLKLTSFQSKPNVDVFKRTVFPLPEGAKYCVAGSETTVGCNKCHCIAGQVYLCTSLICRSNKIKPKLNAKQKPKLNPKQKMQFRPGEVTSCKHGTNVFGYQGCNTCTCIRDVYYCTQFPCNNDKSNNGRNGNRNRRQLEECGEDMRVMQSKDSSLCMCLDRKKVCSVKNCHRNNTIEAASGSRTLQYLRQRLPPYCEDGEALSVDCRVCLCNQGQWECESDEQPFKRMMSGKGCGADYTELPSKDCNKCLCLKSQKVCTVFSCDKKNFKGINAQSTKEEFCEVGSFYNPDGNRSCKNCLCLPNRVSLCFLNLCKYSKDALSYKDAAPGTECIHGQTVKPHPCSTCVCKETGYWVCYRPAKCKEYLKECDLDEEFQLGTNRSCGGCKCEKGTLYCGVTKNACPGYNAEKCTPQGSFVRSMRQPCSACICNPSQLNLCVTDVSCARKVVKDVSRGTN